MAGARITIVLELDEADDSPIGTARLPDGTSRTFHGWLALAGAIDSLAAMTGGGKGRAAAPRTSRRPDHERGPQPSPASTRDP
jgi:hypothetical protein